MTYSIGVPPYNADSSDLLTVLNELADNTSMSIYPKNVRDAFYTVWQNIAFKLTTASGSNTYIGIDQTDIVSKIYLGKKMVNNIPVINNNLLNSSTDLFIYNNNNNNYNTTISILGGTQFYDGTKVTSPYITSEMVTDINGNYVDLTIGNHSYGVSGSNRYGGNINLLSDYGNISINGLTFPTTASNTYANDTKFLQFNYNNGNPIATWQTAPIVPPNFYTFGSTIANFAVMNTGTAASPSSVLPQTPYGVWFNTNNGYYYVAAGSSLNILTTTFSIINSINRTYNVTTTLRGSTASDIVIHGLSNGYIDIYKASTQTLIGSFKPGASYSINTFDIDWINKNIYLPFNNTGGTYSSINVWNMGTTFSGPYTYSTSIPYSTTGVYNPISILIDSAKNRIFSNGQNGSTQVFYLGTASGTVTQYSQIPQSGFNIGSFYSNANMTDITFDNNYYYISYGTTTYNGGIHILRRNDLKYVSFFDYINTGAGASNQAQFLYADSSLNRLHISYGVGITTHLPFVQVISTYPTELLGNTGSNLDSPNVVYDQTLYLTDSTPLPNQVGNLPAGTTFQNESVVDILQQILYPYVAPTISSSINYNTIELGNNTSKSNLLLSYTITKNSTYSINSFTLSGNYLGSLINSSNIANGTTSSSVIPTFSNTSSGSYNTNYFTFSLSDSYGTYLTSSNIVYNTLPFYYGVATISTTSSINTILGTNSNNNGRLTPLLLTPFTTSSPNQNLSLPISTANLYNNQGYIYILLPYSYPGLVQIKEGNGFDITSDFNVYTASISSPNGFWSSKTYSVYLFNSLTTTNTTFQFNFVAQ